MNAHSTSTKLKIQVALLAIVSLALLPTIAAAHGGEEHVTGTGDQDFGHVRHGQDNGRKNR